jgi:hypothetical protein
LAHTLETVGVSQFISLILSKKVNF